MKIDNLNLPGLVAALATVFQTGLLQAIVDEPGLTSEAYAAPRGLNIKGTTLLLEILVAADVLDVEVIDGEPGNDNLVYSPTRWILELDKKLPKGLGGDAQLWSEMFDFVDKGDMPREQTEESSGKIYADKAFAVEELYASAAGELAGCMTTMPKKILDIGCGSGVWSLEMCYIERIYLFDQEPVIEQLRKKLEKADITHMLMAGDYRVLKFSEPLFDRIVIANVLHLESDPFPLLKNWVQGLMPGGDIVIVDNFGSDTLGVRLYEMHLAMRSRTGRNHSLDQICRWMDELGFELKKGWQFEEPATLGAAIFMRKQ